MIKSFIDVTLKNFLSVGRNPVTIPLNSGFSVVVGENGAGKSALFLDGILFALYGKPYRNIRKGQLINSVNQKDCQATVRFLDKKGREWTVQRTIKPNHFRIWQDDEEIEPTAGLDDLQEYLETNILGMNISVFKQIVVVGTAGYTPFMELPAHRRRQIIEDLLEIGLFTDMAEINKREIKKLSEEVKDSEHQEELYQRDIQHKKTHLERVREQQDSKREQLEQELDKHEKNIESIENVIQELHDGIQGSEFQGLQQRLDKISDTQVKLGTITGELDAGIRQKQGMLDFFQQNQTCPTCEQEIAEEHRTQKINEFSGTISESQEKREKAEEKRGELQTRQQEVQDQKNRLDKLKSDLRHQQSLLEAEQNQLENTQNKLNAAANEGTGETDTLKDEIRGLAERMKKIRSTSRDLSNKLHMRRQIADMLKDTGIKTAIVQEYIPFLNSTINQFLETMGADYAFYLDADFKETIKSRGRDTFSYGSFSAGERARIEIAILMAFREVVRVKYGADIDLLILDEVTDGSADADAVESFMKLFRESCNNVIMISHNTLVTEQVEFNTVFEVTKQGMFSNVEVMQ